MASSPPNVSHGSEGSQTSPTGHHMGVTEPGPVTPLLPTECPPKEQVVLILVGLVGSGKVWLASFHLEVAQGAALS